MRVLILISSSEKVFIIADHGSGVCLNTSKILEKIKSCIIGTKSLLGQTLAGPLCPNKES